MIVICLSISSLYLSFPYNGICSIYNFVNGYQDIFVKTNSLGIENEILI